MADRTKVEPMKAKPGVTSERNVTRARMVSQLLMLIFANSVIFGIPYFNEMVIMKYFYIPNATTKFLLNTPTYSILYTFQDSLATGSSTLILDLMIPILVFAFLLLIIGRAWCGWLCPLGFVQDLISRLRRALHINYCEISQRWADVLQRMKYVALFLILYYSLSLGVSVWGLNYFKLNKLPYFNMTLPLPYEQLDPNRALFVFPQMALGILPMSTVVPLLSIGAFAFFFIMSFKIRKFWCHICPAGAMNTPFNRVSLLKLGKDADKCTHCRVCLRVCPMEITKVYEGRENDDVSSWKCVHCYRCVESCPEKDCLNVNFIGKKIISSKSFGE